MAVKPLFKFTLGGYSLLTRELTYRDETGSYDATTNPGGYGAPNDARADYGLFVVAQRHETHQRVTLSSAVVDPLTADTFTTLPRVDGWVQTTAYAVPVGDSTVAPPPAPALPVPVLIPVVAPALSPLMPVVTPPAYVRQDVPTGLFIYDVTLAELFQRVAYLDPANATVSEWVPAAAVELIDSTYLVATLNELVAVDAPELRARLNAACILLDFDLVPDQFNEPQAGAVRKAYDRVKLLLEGAAYQWRLGNYYVAQQNIETIADLNAATLL